MIAPGLYKINLYYPALTNRLQLTLALLVLRIRADHTNSTVTADNLAVTAHFLD